MNFSTFYLFLSNVFVNIADFQIIKILLHVYTTWLKFFL